jgi:tetratricopeptide (TPR) repeat protein
MAANVPITRQIAWLSLVPHVLVISLFLCGGYIIDPEYGPYLGILLYLALAYGLKSWLAGDNQRGMRLVKRRSFEEAIPFFERSVAYFTKNSWIDNYRFLTLLSSSQMSYKEIGLCNIAFCYSQTGNGWKAKEYYERVNQEFPNNGLAISGLNMIKSLSQLHDN